MIEADINVGCVRFRPWIPRFPKNLEAETERTLRFVKL
jgi:hypothetical protein